jgi:hypothetical protein
MKLSIEEKNKLIEEMIKSIERLLASTQLQVNENSYFMGMISHDMTETESGLFTYQEKEAMHKQYERNWKRAWDELQKYEQVLKILVDCHH